MVILDLVRTVGTLAEGRTTTVELASRAELDLVHRWCELTGNTMVSAVMAEHDSGVATVSRGRSADPSTMLSADRLPGARLWIYTNFNCNLACDYCCVASSPRADPRELGLDAIDRLVREGAAWGVGEVYLTGGEPFLLADIDRIVQGTVEILPTTLLTNGMLFRGRGLRLLQAMPRTGFALQVSIDSATPEVHDSHRGRGSWARAIAGIRVAMDEGFTVRTAATIASSEDTRLGELTEFFDGLGIAREDQIIRPVAQQGVADEGVALSLESLVPEITVTAEGVYWHPVAATDERALVTREFAPLGPALDEVTRRFAQQWAERSAATSMFTCA